MKQYVIFFISVQKQLADELKQIECRYLKEFNISKSDIGNIDYNLGIEDFINELIQRIKNKHYNKGFIGLIKEGLERKASLYAHNCYYNVDITNNLIEKAINHILITGTKKYFFEERDAFVYDLELYLREAFYKDLIKIKQDFINDENAYLEDKINLMIMKMQVVFDPKSDVNYIDIFKKTIKELPRYNRQLDNIKRMIELLQKFERFDSSDLELEAEKSDMLWLEERIESNFDIINIMPELKKKIIYYDKLYKQLYQNKRLVGDFFNKSIFKNIDELKQLHQFFKEILDNMLDENGTNKIEYKYAIKILEMYFSNIEKILYGDQLNNQKEFRQENNYKKHS